jgi:hypothetical protein
VKGKITPKTGMKRTPRRLIVFLFSIILVEYILGCFQPPAVIPEELNGKYRTSHLEYQGQFFELSPRLITLGFSGGKYKYYNIKRVAQEILENRILYTILCGNDDKGEEFNFSFFSDPAGGRIIHFKNKPQVAWLKQETEISYNDNSDLQIRH